MTSRFLQLHFLTSYPASLLNRDDVGLAKRMPFGGATRTRISSQCLKRHWRTFSGEHAWGELEVPASIRSRRTFEEYVVKPLIAEGVDADLVRQVTAAVMSLVLGESIKAKAAKDKKSEEGDADEALETGQVTVLGRPEVEYLLGEVRQLCAAKPNDEKALAALIKEQFQKEAKKNIEALRLAAGLDAALFGRMVTSDILARGDAALHVAHALTVHAEQPETDYFSALDDLRTAGGELGSGHIGNTELTSGLFYGYVAVDLPLLVSNLEGCKRETWQTADRALAGKVLQRLVHLIATVSPGAKLGSTAPYSHAHCVVAEVGTHQPRTLANAFLKPVPARPDLVANTYQALDAYVNDLEAMYDRGPARAVAAIGPKDQLSTTSRGEFLSLQQLSQWVCDQVCA